MPYHLTMMIRTITKTLFHPLDKIYGKKEIKETMRFKSMADYENFTRRINNNPNKYGFAVK